MEIERIYKCDRCQKDEVHAKVWIRRSIYLLCKDCKETVEKIDTHEEVKIEEMGLKKY